MREGYDIVIAGAGIAGLSLAYFLAERGARDVIVLEREPSRARHASGRSARTVVEHDPHPVVERLKIKGAAFLREPPESLTSDGSFVDRSGSLRLFRGAAWERVTTRRDALESCGLELELLSPDEAAARVGVLDPEELEGALWMPGGGFLDVPRLLDCYTRGAERGGIEIEFSSGIEALRPVEGGFEVRTNKRVIEARTLVAAAGAWTGELAVMAGAANVELRALRRSIATFEAPRGVGAEGWPIVWSDFHSVYFRPDPDGLMFCPMDEVPSPACDAQPDDRTFDEAAGRLARLAPALAPDSYVRRWAGLRTFAPDGAPVVGRDPVQPGFFWLAGQGGCGIETSGVLGRLAADLILDGDTEEAEKARLSPERFSVAD